MKKIALIGIVLVSLVADLFALASTNFWNTEQVYLDYPLLALVVMIVCNYLIIKFLSNTTSKAQKFSLSGVVILINFLFITTFLVAIDGSAVHIFGHLLISSSYPSILPYFFFPKYLFIFPLLIGLIFGYLSRSQKSKGLLYPYLTISIFSFILFLMYLLNLNFFYNLFHFAGVASHAYPFGMYFLIGLVVSLIISYLISRGSQAKP
jgi:hypothetical protein